MMAVRLASWALLVLAVPALFVGTATPVNAEASFSMGHWLSDALPCLVAVLLPGLAAAWLATGRRGVGVALGWIGGARDEALAPTAARALASAARATTATGLVFAIASLVFVSALASAGMEGGNAPSPAFLAGGISAGLLPPLFALLLGRCLLGACAADAALRAGERHGRTQRGWSEVSVPLLLVVLPTLLMLSTLITFRVSVH